MATYVFFDGYGEWGIYGLPLNESYIGINRHQSGYFMISLEDERRYKHLGILPFELLPCKEKINGCAFQEVINIGWYDKTQFLIDRKYDGATFYISTDEKYSLVVVDLKDIQTVEQPPAQTSSQESEVSTMQALNNQSNPNYISKDLKILNRAAIEIWESVDPTDKAAHPDKDTVIKWLKLNKISSEASAKQGATIIRPDWANRGRPPLKKEV